MMRLSDQVLGVRGATAAPDEEDIEDREDREFKEAVYRLDLNSYLETVYVNHLNIQWTQFSN